MQDISWHLRYYEYSFMFYISFSAGIVFIYIMIYCLKVPAQQIPNLEEIIATDAEITDFFMAKLERMDPLGHGDGDGSGVAKIKKVEYCIVSQQDRVYHVIQAEDSHGLQLRQSLGQEEDAGSELSVNDSIPSPAGRGKQLSSDELEVHIRDKSFKVVEKDLCWLRKTSRRRVTADPSGKYGSEEVIVLQEGEEGNESEQKLLQHDSKSLMNLSTYLKRKSCDGTRLKYRLTENRLHGELLQQTSLDARDHSL